MPNPYERAILDIRDSHEPLAHLRQALDSRVRPLVVVMSQEDPRVLAFLVARGEVWHPEGHDAQGAWVIELLSRTGGPDVDFVT